MQEFFKTEKDQINYIISGSYLHNFRDCKQNIYDFIIYANNKYFLANFNYKGVFFFKATYTITLIKLIIFYKTLKSNIYHYHLSYLIEKN